MSDQLESFQLVEGVKFSIFKNDYGIYGDLIRERWSQKNLQMFDAHFWINKSLWRSLKDVENEIATAISTDSLDFHKTLVKQTLLKVYKRGDDVIVQLIKFMEKEKCYDYIKSLKLTLEAWNKMMSLKDQIDVHLGLKRKAGEVPTVTLYRIKCVHENGITDYGSWNTCLEYVQSEMKEKTSTTDRVDLEKECIPSP
ncbi:unnamed protein product [Owenia fusiformis]|uniref:Uncharacterized protein n=1 Tax=Owenia fusiformis TaxID=6347 RepID=A0A8S4PWX2_OWEFU|nr:unnamed protein product [Owenia fusiformis]